MAHALHFLLVLFCIIIIFCIIFKTFARWLVKLTKVERCFSNQQLAMQTQRIAVYVTC